MKNPLRTLAAVVLLSISSAILGGLVSIHLYSAGHHIPSEEIVRTQRLELIDTKGTVRAVMGLESNGDVVLSMFSPDSTPLISLGVLGKTKERQEIAEASTGLPVDIYPAPFLQMNGRTGRESINLTTAINGYGRLSFSAGEATGKVQVGFFSDEDFHNGVDVNGNWGLVVRGRGANGLPMYTGVAMSNHNGVDESYLIPHPSN